MKAWLPVQSALVLGKIIRPNMEASDSYLKGDFSFGLSAFVICVSYEFEVTSKFVPINKQGGLKLQLLP